MTRASGRYVKLKKHGGQKNQLWNEAVYSSLSISISQKMKILYESL